MLLHGDGTNGAQNNTFLDSSTNNFTVTRNGTPTQGSFSPYGDLWSNFFSGSGQYLTTASSGTATGNFTYEAWVYPTASAVGIVIAVGSEATGRALMYVNASQQLVFDVFAVGTFTLGGTVTLNQWSHIALVRSGTTVRGYVNGTVLGTTATYASTSGNANGFAIAASKTGVSLFAGFISNARVVNGTAVYTSNFTPSTTPLTAITNTSLLTCQSNRFRDNSSNNFAITVTGAPSVQRFSPFDPVAAYSTSVIGGSGYFNGSAQYLNIAATASTQLNADFTIEAWVWIDSTVTASRPDNLKVVSLFSSTGSASGTCLFSIIGSTSVAGTGLSIYQDNAALNASITQNIPLDSWVHLAFVRTGSTLYGFINGIRYTFTVVSGSATATLGNSTSGSRIGAAQNTSFFGYWKGYISNFRLVKGTAVYTANFTPPTAPLTAITNTSLLLNTVNAGIFDNAMMNDLVTVGNAQVSTAVTKFGTGSMAFDGTGDWLTFIDTPNVQLGTGDFTIEGWVYLSALGSVRGFFSKGTSTTGISLGVNALNQLVFNYTASSLTATTALVISTWYHVAVVRNGTATGNVKIYLNGTADATSGGAINDNFNQTSIGYVGADRVATSPMNGYIDDLRVTKGIARYTANFTPPTAAFPNN